MWVGRGKILKRGENEWGSKVCMRPERTKDVDIDHLKMLNFYNYSICICFRLTLVGCLDPLWMNHSSFGAHALS